MPNWVQGEVEVRPWREAAARGQEAGAFTRSSSGHARREGVIVIELDRTRIPWSKAMAVRIDGSLPPTVGNREGA